MEKTLKYVPALIWNEGLGIVTVVAIGVDGFETTVTVGLVTPIVTKDSWPVDRFVVKRGLPWILEPAVKQNMKGSEQYFHRSYTVEPVAHIVGRCPR